MLRGAQIAGKDGPKAMEILIKEQEVSVQQSGQGAEQWFKRAKVVGIVGNIIRYMEYEGIVRPQMDRLLKLMLVVGKDNHPIVREFFLHYSHLITMRLALDYPKFF